MIIGIAGKQRAGKSSLAAYLKARFGGDILPLAFMLKRVDEQIWGHAEKSQLTRKRWQFMGNTARQFDDHAWLKAWFRLALRTQSGPGFITSTTEHVYVDDIRYRNELAFFQTLGAPIIRLEVTPEQQAQRGGQMRYAEHVSEKELDDSIWFDLVVPSSTSLETVRQVADDFLSKTVGILSGEDADGARDAEAFRFYAKAG